MYAKCMFFFAKGLKIKAIFCGEVVYKLFVKKNLSLKK